MRGDVMLTRHQPDDHWNCRTHRELGLRGVEWPCDQVARDLSQEDPRDARRYIETCMFDAARVLALPGPVLRARFHRALLPRLADAQTQLLRIVPHPRPGAAGAGRAPAAPVRTGRRRW